MQRRSNAPTLLIGIADSDLGFSHDNAALSTRTGSIIQARLEPHFVSAEASREIASKVQAKLSSVSANARKMELINISAQSATDKDFQFSWERGTG